MKQKLTITVDADLLPLARQYAEARGISLSSLIEQALRDMAEEETPAFATKWRGKFRAAELKDDPRYDAMANKYLSSFSSIPMFSLTSPSTEFLTRVRLQNFSI